MQLSRSKVKRTIRRLALKLVRTAQISDMQTAQARLAFEDSQRFIYDNSSTETLTFVGKDAVKRLFKHCIKIAPPSGALFEFGVFKGTSINFLAREFAQRGDDRTIYGFDSWAGFSEEWSGVHESFPQLLFDQGGARPIVESNVHLIDGFIEQTLPSFISESGLDMVSFAHIDTDTYSPANTVLRSLRPFLVSGSILIFDELCGYPNWRNHEYRALIENLERSEYDFIGFAVDPGLSLVKAALRTR